MQKTILKTENLEKVYQSNSTGNLVISNLNLEIFEGEFAVIMGSSGSGKSTLLYLLSGLDSLSSGKIWLKKEPLHLKSEKELALLRRNQIGFIFQHAHLIPNLTVLENILVAGYLLGRDKAKIRKRAMHLLQQTGLEKLANRLPSQLSGGEQQRCAIVRALINAPQIILADEPTGNLNAAASTTILDIFSQFHQLGQTILMVTHDIKSACRGERVLYFRDGQVVDTLRFTGENLGDRESELIGWLSKQGW